MTGQRQPRNKSHHHKTQDCEPRGRAVLLVSLTLLLSAQAPFPNKVSCFVSMCVSSDNSFPRVRQEPTLRPWKGSPFLKHLHFPLRFQTALPNGTSFVKGVPFPSLFHTWWCTTDTKGTLYQDPTPPAKWHSAPLYNEPH